MSMDMFDSLPAATPSLEPIADGAVILRAFAYTEAEVLLAAVARIGAVAPFRHMQTPGAHRMSVAMTNCGAAGWVSDVSGYRYAVDDPLSSAPWPSMPIEFARLAERAAHAAGFADFVPDACLINRYESGARMGLHQDRDEADLSAPIVSVSLGVAATFLFGGLRRSDTPRRYRLQHGDVVVWGGSSRLAFHGVAPMARGDHLLTGSARINLTFRKAF